MTEYPYILFNKSPEQLRRLGACGGRAHARNLRARRAVLPPSATLPPAALPPETTAEAVHLLDAQFPWLRGAEQRPEAPRGARGAPACRTLTR